LIETANAGGKAPEYGKIREEVRKDLVRINTYLRAAQPRSSGPHSSPVDVDELEEVWHAIRRGVKSLQGPARDTDPKEFRPNHHIANFVSKTSNEFVAESEAACQRVMEAIRDIYCLPLLLIAC
jgi:hypothetical protein